MILLGTHQVLASQSTLPDLLQLLDLDLQLVNARPILSDLSADRINAQQVQVDDVIQRENEVENIQIFESSDGLSAA